MFVIEAFILLASPAIVANELDSEYEELTAFCACEALIANEEVTALEEETAKDALVANELDIAKDEVVANELDIANELVTALEELIAKDEVPNREPVKEPVKLPVLYEEVKALNDEVVTKEPVLIVVPPAFKAKEAVNA